MDRESPGSVWERGWRFHADPAPWPRAGTRRLCPGHLQPTGISPGCPGQAPLGALSSLLRFPLWHLLGIALPSLCALNSGNAIRREGASKRRLAALWASACAHLYVRGLQACVGECVEKECVGEGTGMYFGEMGLLNL